MSNDTDDNNYVLLSSIRPGLKREFAFAMKSQSENYISCSRTRRRKSPERSINKKPKTADLGFVNEEKVESVVTDEEESKSDVVDPNRSVIEPMNEVKSELIDEIVNDNGGNEEKVEMKMMKKDVVKKFPKKLKELLETGLLEGLSVRYIRGTKVYSFTKFIIILL